MSWSRRAIWLLAGGLAVAGLPARAQTNQFHRTVSSSRQFVCYAPNPLLSPALGVFAEQVKREWLRALNLSDDWRDPILLVVEPRAAGDESPTPMVRVFQTELHLKYQLTWRMPPPLDQRALVVGVVESLCAEYANRQQTVATDGRVAPIPAWLGLGGARLIQGRDEHLVQLARRSIAGGRPLPALTLLTSAHAPADAAGRQLWEANAWIFLQSLLGLPQGLAKLPQFLTELGAQKSITSAFWSTYRTDFADEAALERWWAVQLANRTTTVVAQNLTGPETAEQLDTILATTLTVAPASPDERAKVAVPLAELANYTKQSWLADTLQEKLARLANLRAQSAPHYRPVVEAYMDALHWLADRSVSRFRHGLKVADKLRAKTDKQSQAIHSYLNAAEAKHAPLDGAPDFGGAFQTLSQVEAIEQSRRTPISDYLDQFDR